MILCRSSEVAATRRLLVYTLKLEMLEIKSFVGVYHAYMDIWTPEEGERLNLLREPDNIKDK